MSYDTFPGDINANFTATPTEGPVMLKVVCTDQSSVFDLIDENDATDLIEETGDAPDIVQEVGY